MSAPTFKTGLARVAGDVVVTLTASDDSGDAFVVLTPEQAERVAASLLDLASKARQAVAS